MRYRVLHIMPCCVHRPAMEGSISIDATRLLMYALLNHMHERCHVDLPRHDTVFLCWAVCVGTTYTHCSDLYAWLCIYMLDDSGPVYEIYARSVNSRLSEVMERRNLLHMCIQVYIQATAQM